MRVPWFHSVNLNMPLSLALEFLQLFIPRDAPLARNPREHVVDAGHHPLFAAPTTTGTTKQGRSKQDARVFKQ